MAAVAGQPPPAPYKPDQLMRLKIVMRESEREPRMRYSMGDANWYANAGLPSLGSNEGTVRFMFAPPGIADDEY